jgi:hypothetical protein
LLPFLFSLLFFCLFETVLEDINQKKRGIPFVLLAFHYFVMEAIT